MARRTVRAVCLWALLGVAVPGFAQEGHPLTGTWSGDWGPSATERHHITVVMRWDGTEITGLINPGPDGVAMDSVFLDVTNWTVRIQAGAGRAGEPPRITAEGRLDDIGSYHRTLSGTWRQGTLTGEFRLTRD